MATVLRCPKCGFGIEHIAGEYEEFCGRDGESCHEKGCAGEMQILIL